jgi:hypothetical protein
MRGLPGRWGYSIAFADACWNGLEYHIGPYVWRGWDYDFAFGALGGVFRNVIHLKQWAMCLDFTSGMDSSGLEVAVMLEQTSTTNHGWPAEHGATIVCGLSHARLPPLSGRDEVGFFSFLMALNFCWLIRSFSIRAHGPG